MIPTQARAAIDTGIRLALITAVVVGGLAVLHEFTRGPIERNQQIARVALLAPLVDDPRLATSLGTPPAADVRLCDAGIERFRLIRGSTDGYSGSIDFVMILSGDGALLGVRVTHHTETPGLGDAIEPRHSDWIHQLRDSDDSTGSTSTWRLSRDGGQIDAISGATITSRALLNGVVGGLEASRAGDRVPCTQLR